MGRWFAAAGLNGFMGVALGAWAAHGAVNQIGQEATDWVKTGADYQLWHAAALLALAAGPVSLGAVRSWVASCFCLGALLFSGSLYLLAILDWHWVVFVTPLGGMVMLLGWLILLGYGIREWRNHR
jgi:uncharacterized membrane protein YgdD (TMEM256/DUF423 family)